MPLKELEQALQKLVLDLKPAPEVPADAVPFVGAPFDRSEPDNSRWKALISRYLETAERFEIHCWSDEQEAIRLALQHGVVKPFDWKYGTVIEGPVTADFSRLLLDAPKPADCDMGRRLTPFFTINLDHHFSSGHYGTELAWSPLPEE